ncbi:MAG: hypothetical protein HLUCCA11_02660 [Phormidesmis priestleyi Ana]|uniref:Uncharacterized protein n=1 Tax=Phormidesmis priestleyi Ana TaxID=1666911 RepID=A0A0P8C6G1_9CYAN|nr:MAG: hypothetical protein HLUCCA11_02660 [Phormidesmis priestleyi Ana]
MAYDSISFVESSDEATPRASGTYRGFQTGSKRASRTIPANDFSRFQSISVTSDDANVCTQVKDTPVKDTPVKDAQVKDAQAKDTQVKDTTFGSP